MIGIQRCGVVLLVFALTSPLAAQAPEKPEVAQHARTPLLASIDREAIRAGVVERSAISHRTQSSVPQPSWARRHPVVLGAIAGAGIGAASSAVRWTELYCANGGDEDCLFHGAQGVFFGAGVGAGIGALIGLVAR
jgi:hypothetical protein